MKCLGRDPAESNDLLKDFNPEQDKLSFAEFLVIMKQLENRLVVDKKEKSPGDQTAEGEEDDNGIEDRTKYGALLPRTGVHFLPDSKVVDFLK